MNKGLAIRFGTDSTVTLLTNEQVSGFVATVQNALVNLLTEKKTDPVFPGRGTSLLRTALDGGIFSVRSAAHAANFAAVDTLFFSREYETADSADKLAQVSLAPSFLGLGRLEVQASFVSISGTVMSYPLPVTSVQTS